MSGNILRNLSVMEEGQIVGDGITTLTISLYRASSTVTLISAVLKMLLSLRQEEDGGKLSDELGEVPAYWRPPVDED